MAREFLARGDSVCVNSRSDATAKACAAGLAREFPDARVFGHGADVTSADEVDALAANAAAGFAGHGIDVWINNAGMSIERKPLWEQSDDALAAIVQTNLTGKRVDVLIHVLHQVDNTVCTEAGHTMSGRRVKNNKLIPECDVNDLPARPVISIGQSTTRKSPWRRCTTFPLIEAMHPEQLPSSGIGSDDRPA